MLSINLLSIACASEYGVCRGDHFTDIYEVARASRHLADRAQSVWHIIPGTAKQPVWFQATRASGMRESSAGTSEHEVLVTALTGIVWTDQRQTAAAGSRCDACVRHGAGCAGGAHVAGQLRRGAAGRQPRSCACGEAEAAARIHRQGGRHRPVCTCSHDITPDIF